MIELKDLSEIKGKTVKEIDSIFGRYEECLLLKFVDDSFLILNCPFKNAIISPYKDINLKPDYLFEKGLVTEDERDKYISDLEKDKKLLEYLKDKYDVVRVNLQGLDIK